MASNSTMSPFLIRPSWIAASSARGIEAAEVLSDGTDEASSGGGDSAPSPKEFEGFNIEIIKQCSARDPSDTDNAERLMAHFGRDLTVLAQDGVTGGDWLAWTGTHWDIADGAARARMLAQKVGFAIKAEAMFLALSPREQALVEEWDAGKPEFEVIEKIALKDRSDEQKKRGADLMRLRDEADAIRQSLKKRKKSR
jgi:putative DNA primase/helicase